MTSAWVGERVRLRGYEPEDWAAFHSFDDYSDDVRNGWLLTPPRSVEGSKKWAAELAVKEPDFDRLQLVIATRDGDDAVGSISTYGADRQNGTFHYGIAIGTPHHRKGYASEAIVLVLRYMFGERRFQKCDVYVYASNSGSQALHRSLGFMEEGRRRRARYFAGRYDDELLLGVTLEEFADRHGLAPLEGTQR